MKRTKTLVASILATIVNAIWVFMGFYICYVMFAVWMMVAGAQSAGVGMLMFMGVAVFEVLLIVALVLSCSSFGAVGASKEKYGRKKGVVIASIVFNFIVMIYFLLSLMPGEEPTSMSKIVMALISFGILLASNILYIVDLAQEKKRIAKLEAEQQAAVQAAPVVEPAPAVQTKEEISEVK